MARPKLHATSGVMGRVALPEPRGLGVGMEQFAKEQNIIARIRWDRYEAGKTSNFPLSRL